MICLGSLLARWGPTTLNSVTFTSVSEAGYLIDSATFAGGFEGSNTNGFITINSDEVSGFFETVGNTRLSELEFEITATAIPEPTSLSLLSLGALALLSRRKR